MSLYIDPNKVTECSITLERFVEPASLNCAHKFEELSALELQNTGKPCPLCRAQITKVTKDTQFKAALDAIATLQNQVTELQKIVDDVQNAPNDPQTQTAQKTIIELKRQISDLQKDDTPQFRKTMSTVTQLSNILEDLTKSHAITTKTLTEENARLRDELTKRQDLQKQNDDLKRQLSELQRNGKRKEPDSPFLDIQPTHRQYPQDDFEIETPQSHNFGFIPATFDYSNGKITYCENKIDFYELNFKSTKPESTIKGFTFNIGYNKLFLYFTLNEKQKTEDFSHLTTVEEKYNFLKSKNHIEADFMNLFDSIVLHRGCTKDEGETLKSLCVA